MEGRRGAQEREGQRRKRKIQINKDSHTREATRRRGDERGRIGRHHVSVFGIKVFHQFPASFHYSPLSPHFCCGCRFGRPQNACRSSIFHDKQRPPMEGTSADKRRKNGPRQVHWQIKMNPTVQGGSKLIHSSVWISVRKGESNGLDSKVE